MSADKAAVFWEAFRVLRPGGRLAMADVAADADPGDARRADLAAWAGCLAGAQTRPAYAAALREAGFAAVSITDSHPVADGFTSVLVRAVRPAGDEDRGHGA